jgi:hypothetical protein
MDSHDRLLAAFLAGELDSAAARRWDEHLLACEQCWRAVREDRSGRQAAQMLRQPVPPRLADRVALAVEVAATDRTAVQRQAPPGSGSRRGARQGGRPRWHRLAGAGALAAGLAATLVVLLLPAGRQAGSVPAAVAAVTRYAQAIPAPPGKQYLPPGGLAGPVAVGHPVTVIAGGQRLVMRIWRLGRIEAVVAVSGQPFPMPARAQGMSGRGMAWTARLGTLSLYCLNGRTSELVAAPVPITELTMLAARLPPA